MRFGNIVFALLFSCPIFLLRGQGVSEHDAELTRLVGVLDSQKIDYYKDETRIVIVERLAQLKNKDELIAFVGKNPKDDRYTISWLRENLILIDFLLREKSPEANEQAEKILRGLLKLEESTFLQSEISGDRLKAMETPSGREAHYPPSKEVLEQNAKERIARAEALVKKSFSQQRVALANRLAVVALQTGGIKKLAEIMKEFNSADIHEVFGTQMSRAIISDK